LIFEIYVGWALPTAAMVRLKILWLRHASYQRSFMIPIYFNNYANKFPSIKIEDGDISGPLT